MEDFVTSVLLDGLLSMRISATKCVVCTYTLTGLPDEGRCPECGNTYGGEEIVLVGSREIRTPWQWGRKGMALLSALIGCGFLTLALVALLAWNALFPTVFFGALALAMFTLTLGIWFFGWLAAEDNRLLYLARHGYGAGDVRRGIRAIIPWEPGMVVRLSKLSTAWVISIRVSWAAEQKIVMMNIDSHLAAIQERLEKWQTARVIVERI